MARSLYSSRHPNVRCFLQSTYIREIFLMFPELTDEEILLSLEDLNNQQVDDLLKECMNLRAENELRQWRKENGIPDDD